MLKPNDNHASRRHNKNKLINTYELISTIHLPNASKFRNFFKHIFTEIINTYASVINVPLELDTFFFTSEFFNYFPIVSNIEGNRIYFILKESYSRYLKDINQVDICVSLKYKLFIYD